ncbi:transposase [Streptomyces rhizosphaericus]|uniref:Transposase DDE domain-containing protein n=1 Tax=Streptomyces rhizosphaericus TaxID=114699 RepID=A0A6G4AJ05_9ACTN|nr:transposase [Streptomyces rhizosphaericus]NEW72679.1 hypothetical protein [Streptomyces rhizosphaericus]
MVDLTGYPDGTRIIVRRERPHPDAQLSLFDLDEGLRHQVFLTDTPLTGGGPLQHLEMRHRAHARIEDRIRCGKTIGFGRFPSRHFAINAAWLELSLTDRPARLDPGPAAGRQTRRREPKKLRYRLLHTTARITRGGRRLYLRIAETWPWRHALPTAFARLVALPQPATSPANPPLSDHNPRNLEHPAHAPGPWPCPPGTKHPPTTSTHLSRPNRNAEANWRTPLAPWRRCGPAIPAGR